MDVFISYSTDDDKFANVVVHVLKKIGLSVWIASKEIYEGEEFPEKIADAIEKCKCMVVISSENSNGSDHVANEIAFANSLPHIKKITYMIDSIHDKLDLLLGVTQWIDSCEDKFEKLDVLVKTVCKALDCKTPETNDNHIGNLNSLKLIKKASGRITLFVLAAEILFVSWYFGNRISFYYFGIAIAFMLFSLLYIAWQKNKCFYRCCGKKKTSELIVINDKNKREYRFSFCNEHKHTFDMYKKLKPNILVVYLLILIIAVVAGYFIVRPPKEKTDIILTHKIAEKAGQSICALPQNTVAIKEDGSIYSFEEDIEEEFAQEELAYLISGSETHIICLGIDGSIAARGNNKYGECNISVIDADKIKSVEAGNGFTVILFKDGTVAGVGNNEYGQIDFGELTDVSYISAGASHTLVVKEDGTVEAFGKNDCGQCEVENWMDIVSVSAGENISAGLKKDGTVVTTAGDVNWKGIVDVSAGDSYAVGLKKNGTVLLAGQNDELYEAVSELEDIVAIDAYRQHIAALKNDGTIIDITQTGETYADKSTKCLGAALNTFESAKYYSKLIAISDGYVISALSGVPETSGSMPEFEFVGFENIKQIIANENTVVGINKSGSMAASAAEGSKIGYPKWQNILMADMSDNHLIGIKEDGTLTAAGTNSYGQADIDAFKNIEFISVSEATTVAVRADGKAMAAGDNSYGQCDVEMLSEVIMADAGKYHTVAVLSDGSAKAVGRNSQGQCDVADWQDIVSVAAGDDFTIGLKKDGNVIVAGAVKIESEEIVQIVSVGACGKTYYLLRQDGKLFVMHS